MSKRIRSPDEKKRLSLEKDRRNTYGENDKSSRKNIPRSKARSHRAVRRTADTLLLRVTREDEAEADALESTIRTPRLQKGKWRKTADTPLGSVLERKRKRRETENQR